MDIIIKCLAFIGAVSVLGSMVLVVSALRVMKAPDLDSGKRCPNIALDMALFQDDRPMFTDSKIEVYKPANITQEEFRRKLPDFYMNFTDVRSSAFLC